MGDFKDLHEVIVKKVGFDGGKTIKEEDLKIDKIEDVEDVDTIEFTKRRAEKAKAEVGAKEDEGTLGEFEIKDIEGVKGVDSVEFAKKRAQQAKAEMGAKEVKTDDFEIDKIEDVEDVDTIEFTKKRAEKAGVPVGKGANEARFRTLGIPAHRRFYRMPLEHYIRVAEKKGKPTVMRALLNLESWNESRAPFIARRARSIIEELKRSRSWNRKEDFEKLLAKKGWDKDLLRETAYAYADIVGYSAGEGDHFGDLRNLHWNGEYTDRETFLKQCGIVGKYNEFDKQVAKEVVGYFGDDAMYRLGRESSVVVYVKSEVKMPPRKGFDADEISEEAPGIIRLWWD